MKERVKEGKQVACHYYQKNIFAFILLSKIDLCMKSIILSMLRNN